MAPQLVERVAAQHFFFALPAGNIRMFPRSGSDTARFAVMHWPVPLRTSPSVSGGYSIEGGGSGSLSVELTTISDAVVYASVGGSTQYGVVTSLTADADL